MGLRDAAPARPRWTDPSSQRADRAPAALRPGAGHRARGADRARIECCSGPGPRVERRRNGAIQRMRCALGVDQDVRGFHERFRFDPLIGRAVRSRPGLRVVGRPTAFEALVWAICEQLIEYERAADDRAAPQRQPWGAAARTPVCSTVRAPRRSPVRRRRCLASLDLSPARALTLVAAAREVARGRVDLDGDAPSRAGAAARPARDRALDGPDARPVRAGPARPAAGGRPRLSQARRPRAATGHPFARATEAEVEEYFAPYAPWCGLAGVYFMSARGERERAGGRPRVGRRLGSSHAPG